jgi:hypothetical protein
VRRRLAEIAAAVYAVTASSYGEVVIPLARLRRIEVAIYAYSAYIMLNLRRISDIIYAWSA